MQWKAACGWSTEAKLYWFMVLIRIIVFALIVISSRHIWWRWWRFNSSIPCLCIFSIPLHSLLFSYRLLKNTLTTILLGTLYYSIYVMRIRLCFNFSSKRRQHSTSMIWEIPSAFELMIIYVHVSASKSFFVERHGHHTLTSVREKCLILFSATI